MQAAEIALRRSSNPRVSVRKALEEADFRCNVEGGGGRRDRGGGGRDGGRRGRDGGRKGREGRDDNAGLGRVGARRDRSAGDGGLEALAECLGCVGPGCDRRYWWDGLSCSCTSSLTASNRRTILITAREGLFGMVIVTLRRRDMLRLGSFGGTSCEASGGWILDRVLCISRRQMSRGTQHRRHGIWTRETHTS